MIPLMPVVPVAPLADVAFDMVDENVQALIGFRQSLIRALLRFGQLSHLCDQLRLALGASLS